VVCGARGLIVQAYMSELGFFFFLRIAVAISSSCGELVSAASLRGRAVATFLGSAPEGSLLSC
jgi:hypothetical protein